jgi:hypothetical protein
VTTIEIGITLETIVCGSEGCGIIFALPETWLRERRRDHKTFYCPNGHNRYYPQKSDEEILREQLATAQGNLNYYQNLAKNRSKEILTLERSRAALKGQTTKLRKRAANGVCAACNRSFSNVARHMASKHPAFAAEVVE